MTRAVVVDTNVVVAGLLTTDGAASVARILDGMLAAAFAYAVSEALLAEYRAVLLRPTPKRRHALKSAEIDDILTDLAQHAAVLAPAVGPRAPDPGDQFLWDLLAAHDALRLVTGDKRLLREASLPGRVLSPQAFLAGD